MTCYVFRFLTFLPLYSAASSLLRLNLTKRDNRPQPQCSGICKLNPEHNTGIRGGGGQPNSLNLTREHSSHSDHEGGKNIQTQSSSTCIGKRATSARDINTAVTRTCTLNASAITIVRTVQRTADLLCIYCTCKLNSSVHHMSHTMDATRSTTSCKACKQSSSTCVGGPSNMGASHINHEGINRIP